MARIISTTGLTLALQIGIGHLLQYPHLWYSLQHIQQVLHLVVVVEEVITESAEITVTR
jgi:hypothetical protein